MTRQHAEITLDAGTSTWSTSPENASFSGETRSKWKVAMENALRMVSSE